MEKKTITNLKNKNLFTGKKNEKTTTINTIKKLNTTSKGKELINTKNQPIIAKENKSNSNTEKKDHFHVLLEKLNSSDNSEKVNSLLGLHELIITKSEETKNIIISNNNILLKSLTLLLKNIFAIKNPDVIPIRLGKYACTVLYKTVVNAELIKNISYNVLFELAEETLIDLTIENLDKAGKDGEGIIVVRSLNSIMLRLMENCIDNQIFSVLLDIMKKYRGNQTMIKIPSLCVKCILKLCGIMSEIIHRIETEKILVKMHEIIVDMEEEYPDFLQMTNHTDQLIVKGLKHLLSEITKIKKDSIVEDCMNGVDKHKVPAKRINLWIKNLLNLIQQNTNNEVLEICKFDNNTDKNDEDNFDNKTNDITSDINDITDFLSASTIKSEEIKIKKQIGEGAFGKVYLADYNSSEVSVKIITLSDFEEEEMK
jgi:hypothetical protein